MRLVVDGAPDAAELAAVTAAVAVLLGEEHAGAPGRTATAATPPSASSPSAPPPSASSPWTAPDRGLVSDTYRTGWEPASTRVGPDR